MTIDISDTIIAKSDQLNAADLTEPVIVQITGARRANDDKQPVILEISGGHQPWKPCKGMRRLLIHFWGSDASAFVGRSVELYRDPGVVYGGKKLGGIRVSGLSDIRRAETFPYSTSKGKWAEQPVRVLKVQAPELTGPDALAQWLEKSDLSAEDLDAYLASVGGKPTTGATPGYRAAVLSKASTPEGIDKITAFLTERQVSVSA